MRWTSAVSTPTRQQNSNFGARAAWRNANRCIGRLYWRSLVVRDKRHVHDSDRIAEECIAHLHSATNRGRIRRSSRSSPPDEPDLLAPRLRNPQLIRYAGRQNGVGVIGDGAYVEFTVDDDRSLWKDRALVELNLAVLWSFDAAGVKIADHQASPSGSWPGCAPRRRPAGWRPLSGHGWSRRCPPPPPPVYHRYYDESVTLLGFLPPEPWTPPQLGRHAAHRRP